MSSSSHSCTKLLKPISILFFRITSDFTAHFGHIAHAQQHDHVHSTFCFNSNWHLLHKCIRQFTFRILPILCHTSSFLLSMFHQCPCLCILKKLPIFTPQVDAVTCWCLDVAHRNAISLSTESCSLRLSPWAGLQGSETSLVELDMLHVSLAVQWGLKIHLCSSIKKATFMFQILHRLRLQKFGFKNQGGFLSLVCSLLLTTWQVKDLMQRICRLTSVMLSSILLQHNLPLCCSQAYTIILHSPPESPITTIWGLPWAGMLELKWLRAAATLGAQMDVYQQQPLS